MAQGRYCAFGAAHQLSTGEANGFGVPLYDLDMEKVRGRIENTPYHYVRHNFAFAVNQENYDLKDKLPGITAPTLITAAAMTGSPRSRHPKPSIGLSPIRNW